jgi:uncharacterized protein YdiU (UPF0061 family)
MLAAMHDSGNAAGWRWDHTYLQLPELFFERTLPRQAPTPKLVVLNARLAAIMGLDSDVLARDESAGVFSGNRIPEGAEPLAQAYAGHQFGHFTGLGDGRAILLGEHLGPDGRRWDVQLKGSGRTRYSRGGDGRAALGPMLREYVISEAMAALGIPTTRSLAVALTGDTVMRDEPLPGAVLTRVAASHIRVGTFQWAAAHDDVAALRALVAHTARRHFPKLAPDDARAFFQAALEKQAALVCEWMRVGFVHGVMNTDNMALSGETIDYGPCAFIDAYDPDAVFSSIDRGGRYAFANQPSIARWNLARLAEALLPCFDADRARAVDFANEVLGGFETVFKKNWLAMMRGKTGLLDEQPGDAALIQSLLDAMREDRTDFTHTFRSLADEQAIAGPTPAMGAAVRAWHEAWAARLARQISSPAEAAAVMRRHNPAAIPRNHLVEAALKAAVDGDMLPFERLAEVLSMPYETPADPVFTTPPPTDAPPYRTFCGT